METVETPLDPPLHVTAASGFSRGWSLWGSVAPAARAAKACAAGSSHVGHPGPKEKGWRS